MSLIIYDIHSYIVRRETSGLILIAKRHEPGGCASRNNNVGETFNQAAVEYLHISSPSLTNPAYIDFPRG